ncbi:DUF3465 domain-containing protein [Gluconobacter wancherniae]|uniref:DUF3465 domain-containing protein n=1 Tax=Gluconobacter wancherniae TaxID=1307955 RepID=UPI001B8D3ED7|nr:DUF3465 domain-containing protein [Gluconobacter wancherniae]MBS1087370.1 DUF3465 domain-containing protein [Gluconobacter wancherniae]
MIFRPVLLAAAACLLAPVAAMAQNLGSMPASCDNSKFLSDQQGFEQGGPRRIDLPEHICGQVIALSPRARRTRSGVHGYFYLNVGQGVSIRIVSNLDEMNAPQWPWVKKGDQVEVQGRYYFDSPRQQGVDWTHRGTGRKWQWPGYIVVNGTRYE